MYILRRISRILFVLSLVLFGVYVYRNKSVVDTRAPEIKINKPLIEISVEDSEEKLLEGVTASDSRDGNVTDSVAVENISTFYGDGKRLVTYVAFDKDNHVSRATREMRYTDYEPPRFILTEPLQYYPGSVNLKVSAKDCLDGDITSAIKLVITDPITTDQPGKYPATFQVANSAGDVSSLPVTIEIMESGGQGAPVINLKKYIDYIGVGDKFNAYSYVKSVLINGREYNVVKGNGNFNDDYIEPDEEIVIGRKMISVSGEVDTKEPGTYRLEYSMTLDRGHNNIVTGHTSIYIVVR